MTKLKNLFLDYQARTRFGENVYYFIKWCALAYIAGAAGGLVGGIFSRAITWVTEFRLSNSWALFLLPVAGLLIVWLYQITGEAKNRGTNMVLSSISAKEEITKTTGPLIFFATILTHLTGGSVGREGAALQLGGSIGAYLARLLHLNEKDKKAIVLCGMSAVFSALFGTPVTAAVFCMEVINVGVFYYAAMLPCLLSAFLGKDVSLFLGVQPEIYTLPEIPALSFHTVHPVVLLGICCALFSILVCTVFHGAEHYYKKFFPNPYIRILVASALFIGLTLLSGTRVYCGTSTILIEESIAGEAHYEAFLLKLLFTAIALGGGFKGGEIVPTLCMGATLGAALGTLLGFEPALMAACGMMALFAGVTNCPLSSILMGIELFRGQGLAYFAVAVSISFALSGYSSLYSAQKFSFSKLSLNRRPEE